MVYIYNYTSECADVYFYVRPIEVHPKFMAPEPGVRGGFLWKMLGEKNGDFTNMVKVQG